MLDRREVLRGQLAVYRARRARADGLWNALLSVAANDRTVDRAQKIDDLLQDVGTEERAARQAWIGLCSRLRARQRFARVVVVLPIVYVLMLFLLWLLR